MRFIYLFTLVGLLAIQPGCNNSYDDDDTGGADDDDTTSQDDDTSGDDDDTGDDDTTAGDDDTGDDDTGIDCDAPGRIVVEIDGTTYFDRTTPIALICLDLQFSTDQYGSGPPGAQIQVVTEAPGLFQAQLLGFDDDHYNCEEKWGFVYLEGDCADVWLEKWNWNACNLEYYTDLMKLETWVDTDGDCAYSHDENDEPYSSQGISWDPGHAYALTIAWE